MEKGRWDVRSDWGWKQGEEKGRGKQSSGPPYVSAGCYGLEDLHLRAFARPEDRGMARQVHSFEGAHWT